MIVLRCESRNGDGGIVKVLEVMLELWPQQLTDGEVLALQPDASRVLDGWEHQQATVSRRDQDRVIAGCGNWPHAWLQLASEKVVEGRIRGELKERREKIEEGSGEAHGNEDDGTGNSFFFFFIFPIVVVCLPLILLRPR